MTKCSKKEAPVSNLYRDPVRPTVVLIVISWAGNEPVFL